GLSRPGIDKYLIVVQDRLMIFPLVKVGEIVRTQKNAKLMLRILLAEVGERVDRVARLRHAKLHVAGSEMVMIRDRQLHHPEPVKFVDQRLLLFEGILRTHHKPDLIEIRPVVERICNDKVTDMDRIEASEEQPYLHLYFA